MVRAFPVIGWSSDGLVIRVDSSGRPLQCHDSPHQRRGAASSRLPSWPISSPPSSSSSRRLLDPFHQPPPPPDIEPLSFVPPGPTPRGPLDDAPTMFSRRPTTSPRPARCTSKSTASITTGLLLSLLALSAAPAVATGHTRQDAQVVFPIEVSPLIPPLLPEPPAPAQHTFVSAPLLLTKCSGPNSTLHRPSDTYTTMGRTDIRRSIARWTPTKPMPTCG